MLLWKRRFQKSAGERPPSRDAATVTMVHGDRMQLRFGCCFFFLPFDVNFSIWKTLMLQRIGGGKERIRVSRKTDFLHCTKQTVNQNEQNSIESRDRPRKRAASSSVTRAAGSRSDLWRSDGVKARQDPCTRRTAGANLHIALVDPLLSHRPPPPRNCVSLVSEEPASAHSTGEG